MSAGDPARIFRHALRARILATIDERGEASPADVSVALGAPLGTVSYHTKVLHEAGWIELARVERRRGARRHVYRIRLGPWLDDDAWQLLPVALRRALTNETLRRVLRTAGGALRGGGFDHAWAHVALVPLRLDEQGVGELTALLDETLDRSLEIRARSEARRGVPVSPTLLALLHYELAEEGEPAPRARRRG